MVSVSSLYRTPPWGKTDQPDFLNAAAEVLTGHSPRELLDLCLEAERRLKRVRQERWGPRLIDIDILVFGDRAVHEGGLEIPHPRMLERAFVLVPLAEIAPDLVALGQAAVGASRRCRHGRYRAAAVRPRLVEEAGLAGRQPAKPPPSRKACSSAVVSRPSSRVAVRENGRTAR